jgi:hypothetical protein
MHALGKSTKLTADESSVLAEMTASEMYITKKEAIKLGSSPQNRPSDGWTAGTVVQGIRIGGAAFVRSGIRETAMKIVGDADIIATTLAEHPTQWLQVHLKSIVARQQYLAAGYCPQDVLLSGAVELIDGSTWETFNKVMKINLLDPDPKHEDIIKNLSKQRAQLRCQDRGLGLGSFEKRSPIAFVAGFISVMTLELTQRRRIEGEDVTVTTLRQTSILSNHLLQAFCPRPINPQLKAMTSDLTIVTDDDTQWLGNMIKMNLPSVCEFQTAWNDLGQEHDGQGLLSVPADHAGYEQIKDLNRYSFVTGQLQKKLQNICSRSDGKKLIENMNELPEYRELRLAFEATKDCKVARSGSGIRNPPHRENRPSAVIFRHCVARMVGAPSQLVEQYVGRKVIGMTGGQTRQHPPDMPIVIGADGKHVKPELAVCDLYGHVPGNNTQCGTMNTRTKHWHNPLLEVCIKLMKKFGTDVVINRENPNLFRGLPTVVCKDKVSRKKVKSNKNGKKNNVAAQVTVAKPSDDAAEGPATYGSSYDTAVGTAGGGSEDNTAKGPAVDGSTNSTVVGAEAMHASDDMTTDKSAGIGAGSEDGAGTGDNDGDTGGPAMGTTSNDKSSTTANSKRQMKAATRHGKVIRNKAKADEQRQTLRPKGYIPDIAMQTNGVNETIEIKTRGMCKTNYLREHPAGPLKKQLYKNCTGKTTKAANWLTSSTFKTTEMYRKRMVNLDFQNNHIDQLTQKQHVKQAPALTKMGPFQKRFHDLNMCVFEFGSHGQTTKVVHDWVDKLATNYAKRVCSDTVSKEVFGNKKAEVRQACFRELQYTSMVGEASHIEQRLQMHCSNQAPSTMKGLTDKDEMGAQEGAAAITNDDIISTMIGEDDAEFDIVNDEFDEANELMNDDDKRVNEDDDDNDNQDSSFSSDTRETSSNSVSAASFTDTPAGSTASTTPEQDLVEDADGDAELVKANDNHGIFKVSDAHGAALIDDFNGLVASRKDQELGQDENQDFGGSDSSFSSSNGNVFDRIVAEFYPAGYGGGSGSNSGSASLFSNDTAVGSSDHVSEDRRGIQSVFNVAQGRSEGPTCL